MNRILPLGSVVLLNGGQHRLMITSRFPLTEKNGILGYYEYGACLYPEGQSNQSTFFFNEEDILEVAAEGFSDWEEEQLQKLYEEKIPKIEYPRFDLTDIDVNGRP